MSNLTELLKNSKLKDIESELNFQIKELPLGYYDAKLAVMLSMLIVNGMEKFDTIDCDNFPEELRKKFKEIQEAYDDKLSRYRKHLDENAKLIRVIEEAESGYPALDQKINSLLSEFDDLLKAKVDERDILPLAKL